jgi:hypothetical protein
MELTDWIPCKTPPVRDGWYDVARNFLHYGSALHPVERVRYENGEWDWLACESKIAIWVGNDYWRGVTEESKGGE